MAHKTLSELRASWRHLAWLQLKGHMPVMAVAAMLVAAGVPAAFSSAIPLDVQSSPLLVYYTLPYILRVALLLPVALLASVPLVLVCNPFPTRAHYAQNEQIRQARAAVGKAEV
jgi:hypothetical protein